MAMKNTISIINQMVLDGIIERYAIGGAVAAYNYIEASSTEDLDILISFEGLEVNSKSGLVTLGPIVTYLADKGYADWHKEGLMIEGWPVQFLPVSDRLTASSLDSAVTVELAFEPNETPISAQILTAEYILAIALNVGRPKDLFRINQFIEAKSFDLAVLCQILKDHGLIDKWIIFCDKFDINNECSNRRVP